MRFEVETGYDFRYRLPGHLSGLGIAAPVPGYRPLVPSASNTTAVALNPAPKLPASLRVNPAFNFPYTIPSPAYVSGYESVTGGAPLLNIGAPLALNDPTEYLRAAMVAHDWYSVARWVDWYSNSHPWCMAAGRFGAPQPAVAVSTPVAAQGGGRAGGKLAGINGVMSTVVTPQQIAAMRGFDFLSSLYTIGPNGKPFYLPLIEIEATSTKLSDVLNGGGACVYPSGKAGFPAAGPGYTRIPPYKQGGTFIYGDCQSGGFWSQWGLEIILLVAACVTAGMALAAMPALGAADATLAGTTTEAAAGEALAEVAVADTAVAGAATGAAASVAAGTTLEEITVTAGAIGAGSGATAATVAAASVAAAGVATSTAGASSAAGNTLEEITVTAKPVPVVPPPAVEAAVVSAAVSTGVSTATAAQPSQPTQPQSNNPNPVVSTVESAVQSAASKIISGAIVKAVTGSPSSNPTVPPGYAPIVDSNGNVVGSAPIPPGQPGSLSSPLSSNTLLLIGGGLLVIALASRSKKE